MRNIKLIETVQEPVTRQFGYAYNIPSELLTYWYLITDKKVGATVIGTGGGCDYIMVRGQQDFDWILVWADTDGSTDASSPEGLSGRAAVVGQYNEKEYEDEHGREWRNWSGEICPCEIFYGTAKECLDFMAQVPGVEHDSRKWEGSY